MKSVQSLGVRLQALNPFAYDSVWHSKNGVGR